MRFEKVIPVFLLFANAAAECFSQQQKPFIGYINPFTGENKFDVVPLNKTVRICVIPINIEENIISCK